MEHERTVQNLAVECYLLGEMTADQRDEFETHYFECAVCADDLRAASQFVDDAKEILASGAVQTAPARNVSQPRRATFGWLNWLQPQFAAAAIAVLVVVAGIESLSTIPALQRRLADVGAPRIVNPTYLKAQTRGEPATLKTVSGEPAVFIFYLPDDLPQSSASELQFVVKSTDGRAVFQVSGRAPARNEPATLTIPKLDLPEGSYTLVVEASAANGQDGQPLGSYPFEIRR